MIWSWIRALFIWPLIWLLAVVAAVSGALVILICRICGRIVVSAIVGVVEEVGVVPAQTWVAQTGVETITKSRCIG